MRPSSATGTPSASAIATNDARCASGTVTRARAADSLKSATNGSSPTATVTPTPCRRQDSTRAWERPPSDRSWAEVTSWEQLQGLIRGNADGAVTIVVDRDGEPVTLHTNTTVTARPTSQTDETLEQVGFLGVVPKDLGPTHGGPLYTAQWMGSATVDVAKALGTLPVKVWHVGLAAVGVEKRDNAGPVSVVGGARIAGEVAASDKLDATDTLVTLLTVVAGFNLFIGLFNFIPLLPLDGGHIAGALYEAVRRGIARLRHRPDPGYVDVAKLLPVAYVVGAALLVMGLVLIVGDIVAPVDVGL